MRLFVGDDWAEDHHDVELMDAAGRVLAKRRLPEGVAGMARLPELVGEQLGDGTADAGGMIGVGAHPGPRVAPLGAPGGVWCPREPPPASRYPERPAVP